MHNKSFSKKYYVLTQMQNADTSANHLSATSGEWTFLKPATQLFLVLSCSFGVGPSGTGIAAGKCDRRGVLSTPPPPPPRSQPPALDGRRPGRRLDRQQTKQSLTARQRDRTTVQSGCRHVSGADPTTGPVRLHLVWWSSSCCEKAVSVALGPLPARTCLLFTIAVVLRRNNNCFSYQSIVCSWNSSTHQIYTRWSNVIWRHCP